MYSTKESEEMPYRSRTASYFKLQMLSPKEE